MFVLVSINITSQLELSSVNFEHFNLVLVAIVRFLTK